MLRHKLTGFISLLMAVIVLTACGSGASQPAASQALAQAASTAAETAAPAETSAEETTVAETAKEETSVAETTASQAENSDSAKDASDSKEENSDAAKEASGAAAETSDPAKESSAAAEETADASESSASTEEAETGEADKPSNTNLEDALPIPLNQRITGTATDGVIWYFSFKTTSADSAEYEIAGINKTPRSKYLGLVLCDEDGKQIDYVYANNLGTASSFITRRLAPDTVYYLKVYSNNSSNNYSLSETALDYAFYVRDLSDKASVALWGDGGAESSGIPGTNQDEAALISINKKITGTATDARISYYAFRTADYDTEYEFGAVNKSLGSDYLGFVLCDQGGSQIDYVYVNDWGTTGSFTRKLSPNSVYYLKLYSNKSSNNYSLSETAVDYVFYVRDRSDKSVGTLLGQTTEGSSDSAAVSFVPGTNQDEAAMIPLNKKLESTATHGLIWYYSFKTDPRGEFEYEIRAVNKTADSDYLGVVLCDEGGRQMDYKYIDASGTPVTFAKKLPADRVYWLKVYSNHSSTNYSLDERPIDYVLSVNADLPEEITAPVATIVEEAEPVDELPYGVSIVSEEEKANPIGYTVNDLLGLGFETEADVTGNVASRAVCDVFTMSKEGIPFSVRAVNPYADGIALGDCIVCYFGISDTTGMVKLDGEISCGSSARADILSRYPDPMVTKDAYLVYQTQNPERDYGNAYGNFVISEDVRTCDVLFRFDEGEKLNEVVFLAPYLLYNTLEENLEDVDVGTADPVSLAEAELVRNDILERLKAAFEKEGVNAVIDEETGKITLDNSILFDFDSYRLSDAGMAYIDSFLRAYASALLDGTHAGKIKTVEFDGHTDTDGSHEYNQKLSENRANAVLEYCVGANGAGLSAEQTQAFREIAVAEGFSFDQPVYDKDGKVDMAASRRVEIKFFLNLED